MSRHRSGALALIGQAIEAAGVTEGDSLLVELDAWQIGDAFAAADDAGLLHEPPAPAV